MELLYLNDDSFLAQRNVHMVFRKTRECVIFNPYIILWVILSKLWFRIIFVVTEYLNLLITILVAHTAAK